MLCLYMAAAAAAASADDEDKDAQMLIQTITGNSIIHTSSSQDDVNQDGTSFILAYCVVMIMSSCTTPLLAKLDH